jgi:ABC-type nickel/cobalt efflux system permease component RcnA
MSYDLSLRKVQLPLHGMAKLAVAVIAAGIVAVGLATLASVVFATGLISAPPRNPFLTGPATYAIGSSAFGGIILTLQAHFYAVLATAVQGLKTGQTGFLTIAAIGFLYGIFHAAGPGHGKGVISGYIIASRGSIYCGLGLSLGAAILQALVAIAVVGIFAMVLRLTATSITMVTRNIELASFAAVAVMGLILLWIKADEFVRMAVSVRSGAVPDDDGVSYQANALASRGASWPVFLGVIAVAGIRPCSGAIILLVFSLSQDLFVAGVLGALAMAVGTWITTGSLAAITVCARTALQRAATAGTSRRGYIVFATFEVLAAAFVLILGAMLFAGVWAGGMFSALD